MAKRKTVVAFKGTAEQEKKLREIINDLKKQGGALMPALQKAQEIYGYLPFEVQYIIAQEFGVSLETVYGVMSFYSQFTLNPKGVNNVSVCMGTACYVKGASEILESVKKKLNIEDGSITSDGLFSLESARCIGACGLAPVLIINDDVYGQVKPSEVGGIIDKYMEGGGKKA